MKSARHLLLACAIVLPAAAPAQQQREPDLGFIFPAGGSRGTTFEATVGGQFLKESSGVLLSKPGIEAQVTGYRKPLPQVRFNEFGMALKDAKENGRPVRGLMAPMAAHDDRKKAVIQRVLEQVGATAEEIELFYEMRDRKQDPKRQPNSQLDERVTLEIQIAPDAEPGPCALRLITPRGVSNPITFIVGTRPEIIETEAHGPLRFPVVINGQILPGESDGFSFRAEKGDRLVFAVQARDLIPYLADAVPGWFQPNLEIRDAAGLPVAHATAYRFNPDPVVFFLVPKTGDYTMEIRDTLYRGREDFVYRVEAGQLPFVTGIFPLGGRLGQATEVAVSGWNLPTRLTTITPEKPGIMRVVALSNGFATIDTCFKSETAARTTAVEPDDQTGHAPLVIPQVSIDGRIDKPGDVDTFALKGRKGEPIVVEAVARRLNSPLDSILHVTDPYGRTLASNDDTPETESPFLTQHADSKLTFSPETDGIYYLHIADAQGKGGPDYSYVLELRPPHADFAARVVPSTVNGPAGANVPVTIHILRKEGFKGEVALELEGAPVGVTLSGGVVPAGCDSVRATISLPATATPTPFRLAMVAKAQCAGKEVVHAVEPCDDLLQAFFYHHLVPAPDFLAYAASGLGKRPRVAMEPGQPVILPLGGTAEVAVSRSVAGRQNKHPTIFELDGPPEGISLVKTEATKSGAVLTLYADPDKVRPGTSGNFIVQEYMEKPEGDRSPRHISIGYLPAIPFTVGALEASGSLSDIRLP